MDRRAIRFPPALRHLVRAAILGLCGAALGFLIAPATDDTATATSRVAVSDNVGWPFWTTSREQLVELAESSETQAAVLRQLDATDAEVVLSAESTDGEITVDVTAESADADLAIEAANVFAEEVVVLGAQRSTDEQAAAIDDISSQIALVDARIAANDAELAALGATLDSLAVDAPQAEQLPLRSEIQRLQRSQTDDAGLRTRLTQQLSQAQIDLEGVESDFDVVRSANDIDRSALNTQAIFALLFGIPFFLIGLGLSVVWDQTYGLVRRPQDVRDATDAAVVTVSWRRAAGDVEMLDLNAFARRVARHQLPGSTWLLIPLRHDAWPICSTLAHDIECLGEAGPDGDTLPADVGVQLEHLDGDTTVITSVADPPSAGRRLVVGPLATLETESAAMVSGAVICLSRKSVRVSRLGRAVDELESEGLPLEAIVFFEKRRR